MNNTPFIHYPGKIITARIVKIKLTPGLRAIFPQNPPKRAVLNQALACAARGHLS
jgi:hypothetical protein